MSLATTMEAAVRAKVGHVQDELVPDARPTYDTLRDLFGSNADIARAAGYGAPGQYKAGTPEYVRRRTFMRNLQRYEQTRTGGAGQRRTARKIEPRLASIARTEQRRRAVPLSVRDVVRLMGMRGTTTSFVLVKFAYSSPKNPARKREIEVGVYTSQGVYRDVGWPMRGRAPRSAEGWEELGAMYLEGWAIAYGIPGELVTGGVEGDPIFLFTIGREAGVTYDYE